MTTIYDAQEIERICSVLRRMCFKKAFEYSLPVQECEDCSSSLILHFLCHIPTRPITDGWCAVVARNFTISWLRKYRHRNSLENHLDDIIVNSLISEDDANLISNINCQNIVNIILDDIPIKHKLIIIKYCIHEMTFLEIGNELGITEDGARKYYYRAVDKIRIKIQNTSTFDFEI